MYNLTLCKLTLLKLSIIIDVVAVAFVAALGANVVFVVSFIVALENLHTVNFLFRN